MEYGDYVEYQSYVKYRGYMEYEVEIAKTRQIVNPGFGFEFMAKPGFGFRNPCNFRFSP